MLEIRQERAEDEQSIEAILDQAFGASRHLKTVYRLREGLAAERVLCTVVERDSEIIGTIRYWPVAIGREIPSLLLGPIAVRPDYGDGGIGTWLIRYTLEKAHLYGYQSVILVGDPGYYHRFGFTRKNMANVVMPGPVDLDRFLGVELVPGALADARGVLRPLHKTQSDSAAQEQKATGQQTGFASVA